MGTNYYLEKRMGRCPTCLGQYPDERLHIGKSSAGWAFSLHVTPEIPTLYHWLPLLLEPGARIVDEYGSRIHPEEMLRVIACRTGDLKRNSSYDNRSLTPGEGSWDYCEGEFS